jgi:alpha-beta hydrolase superfamily lysophospholipase
MARSLKHSPWLPDLLTRLAVATGVGYLAAAYTVSRWLTRPSRGRACRTPGDHGLLWERLECRTSDRLRLVGWAVTPPRPRGTVALFHGNRKNREQTLGRSVFLAAAGYRCVAFDHRAHGDSDGKRISFGYHESRDVAAVLDVIRQRWPGQPRAALGISMGGAALCFAAAQARQLDAVILESVYHDLASAFQRRIGTQYPDWFERLHCGAVWMTERRLGLRLPDVAPANHVGALAPCPVLLLTGSDDRHAPPADTELLYEQCRGDREWWLVPGATHEDTFEVGGAPYRHRVLGFLERWMRV